MQLAHVAAFVHKWLALLVGVQIVFWVASGLFFTLFPIQQIRSENLIRPNQAQTIDPASLPSLAALRGDNNALPTKLTIERRTNGQVVVAEFADAPPALYDATTLQRLSPLSATQAISAARAHVTLTSEPTGATLVTDESAEYRGALPAWRVQFPDGGLAVYVAQNTGAVTARRSDLWRIYDTLWALHIMDWKNHEDFNHPLIIIVSLLDVRKATGAASAAPGTGSLCLRRIAPAASSSWAAHSLAAVAAELAASCNSAACPSYPQGIAPVAAARSSAACPSYPRGKGAAQVLAPASLRAPACGWRCR